jgi:hypothetical protein
MVARRPRSITERIASLAPPGTALTAADTPTRPVIAST